MFRTGGRRHFRLLPDLFVDRMDSAAVLVVMPELVVHVVEQQPCGHFQSYRA